MIKFVSKFMLDILPSVAATVIGAYIVNHYIIARPAPPVAAITSPQPASAETRPAPASDKARAASDRPEAAKRTTAAAAPVEKSRHDHLAAGTTSRPGAVSASSAEARRASAEPREANELARAAIERLRSANPDSHAVEPSARVHEPQRASAAPLPTIAPLPPAISVSNTEPELLRGAGYGPAHPAAEAAEAERDQVRLAPPRDIPISSGLLSQSENSSLLPSASQRTVADDMFDAAKSVFHAVLPH